MMLSKQRWGTWTERQGDRIMSEMKKQKRMVITIWEGGITEIRVPKITLSRRQLLLVALIVIAVLVGIDNLPKIIEWFKSISTLLG